MLAFQVAQQRVRPENLIRFGDENWQQPFLTVLHLCCVCSREFGLRPSTLQQLLRQEGHHVVRDRESAVDAACETVTPSELSLIQPVADALYFKRASERSNDALLVIADVRQEDIARFPDRALQSAVVRFHGAAN